MKRGTSPFLYSSPSRGSWAPTLCSKPYLCNDTLLFKAYWDFQNPQQGKKKSPQREVPDSITHTFMLP